MYMIEIYNKNERKPACIHDTDKNIEYSQYPLPNPISSSLGINSS